MAPFLAVRRLAAGVLVALAAASVTPATSRAADPVMVAVLSQADTPAVDGARLGNGDNASTGRFVGLDFRLEEVTVDAPEDIPAAIDRLAKQGPRLVVTTLTGAELDAALAAPGADKLMFLNAGAADDRFRTGPCRANLLHTLPSRAMVTDALAQFLVKKRWTKWFVLKGQGEGDRLYADALRRAAKRFGAKIVAEKEWPENGDLIRTAQTEVPVLTRGPDYDVLMVADEGDVFGPYIPYQTWDPRPVAGTHGLVASAWHPAVEAWGALQLQSRFTKLSGRPMRAKDYAAWAAVRAVGEAAIRTKDSDSAKITAALRAPDFEMAGFKGRKLSFRDWNGQLRQPIPLGAEGVAVSLSPQEGFLHPTNDMDTLGYDRPETACKGNAR